MHVYPPRGQLARTAAQPMDGESGIEQAPSDSKWANTGPGWAAVHHSVIGHTAIAKYAEIRIHYLSFVDERLEWHSAPM